MPINKLASEINYEKQTVRISTEIHADGANPLFPEGAQFKVEEGAVSIGASGELLFGVKLSYEVPAPSVSEPLPEPDLSPVEIPEPNPPEEAPEPEPEKPAKKGKQVIQ